MSFERRKIRVGRVISDKMDKTVVVSVEWGRPHRIYKKTVRRRTRFNAHDEENRCMLGDLVRIIETRPRSKTKRWRVAEILAQKEIAEIQPDEIIVEEPVEPPQEAETGTGDVQAVATAVPDEPEALIAEPAAEPTVSEAEPTVETEVEPTVETEAAALEPQTPVAEAPSQEAETPDQAPDEQPAPKPDGTASKEEQREQ